MRFWVVVTLLAAAPAFGQRNLDVRPQEQESERRVALVIGNSAYKEAPLANPVNDAVDMAVALERHGFKVIRRHNASQRDMRAAVREFGAELRRADVGLFYYAGHGLQVRGNNYLVPVDADIQTEADAEDLSIDTNYVLRTMEEAQVKVSIVILDACRNNPFGRGFRSMSRGLAQMSAATGSIVAFSTAPGSVAADGTDRNGVYTKHLLANLRNGDTDILRVFQRTRAGVVKETGGRQTPWESTSLIGEFRFAKQETSPVPDQRIPVVGVSLEDRPSRMARQFDAYVRYLSFSRPYTALAFAKDADGGFVYDGTSGHPTPERAQWLVLARCAEAAAKARVKASCQLHPLPVNMTATASGEDVLAEQFELFARYVALGEHHSAVALAREAGKWVWAGRYGAKSPEDARDRVLETCASFAAREGIKTRCEVHSLDGVRLR